jgi:hypothetical protein
MDHGTLRELAAGAAMDDLDSVERGALDAHLPDCAACRLLVADLEGVVGDLALAAPEIRPPAELRATVLTAIRSAEAAPVSLDSYRAATEPRRRASGRRPGLPLLAVAGLAAVLAIAVAGLGLRTMELSDTVADQRSALAAAQARLAAQEAATAVAADPSHVTAALHAEPTAPGATAVVLYRPGTADAYLMANDLPATPSGMVYQLWYADAAGVHPLGTFHHDGEGPFVAPFGVDLTESVAAMVTLEPEGGAGAEPGPEIVFGEL